MLLKIIIFAISCSSYAAKELSSDLYFDSLLSTTFSRLFGINPIYCKAKNITRQYFPFGNWFSASEFTRTVTVLLEFFGKILQSQFNKLKSNHKLELNAIPIVLQKQLTSLALCTNPAGDSIQFCRTKCIWHIFYIL